MPFTAAQETRLKHQCSTNSASIFGSIGIESFPAIRLFSVNFVERGLKPATTYLTARHPLYVDWLLTFWSAPVMTIAHFFFAAMTTAYILVAIRFEEAARRRRRTRKGASMRKHYRSRREFMGLTGAGLAGMVVMQVAPAVESRDPDLVVINAKVYTVDNRTPRAEAFAVKSGRFSAVGNTAEIRALAGKRTEIFDAKQMAVVPGFTDCHNHASGEVLLYEVLVGNPFEVEFVTISSIVEKLRAKAGQTPPGNWVEGFFFDDTKVKDKRELDVHDLDEVSAEHPVAVRHR